MGRPIKSGGIIAALLIALSGMPAFGGTPLPFTLTWVKGVCTNCKTAKYLSKVRFVDRNEAWAIGFLPPGGMGEGDYSVLHTRDGGKHWREIPEPWQHNVAPIISFADRLEGWLKDADGDGQNRLLLTHDGGRHWRRLPIRDLFVSDVQYLGDGIGFGIRYDIYTKENALLATRDFGFHWTDSQLPKGFYPEFLDFVSNSRGYVAGCLDRRSVVARTLDGGAHWKTQVLDLPRPTLKDPLCVSEVDSLDFIDANRGMILASKHSFGLHDSENYAAAWMTADGGASWTTLFRADKFKVGEEALDGVRFLDDRLAFMWKNMTVGNTAVGVLRYTTDGGHTWSELQLPYRLWGCERHRNELDCAEGDGGFSVLRIARVGAP